MPVRVPAFHSIGAEGVEARTTAPGRNSNRSSAKARGAARPSRNRSASRRATSNPVVLYQGRSSWQHNAALWQRDRDGQGGKGEGKREHRDNQSEEDPPAPPGGQARPSCSTSCDLHGHDDGRLTLEDFDEQKAELTDQIAIRMASESL
jgi:hypothetical protein